MHADAQKMLDAAMSRSVQQYLYACKKAEDLRLNDSEENRHHDSDAHGRVSGGHEILGALLDACGYDVRMAKPTPITDRPEETTFIQWTKVEREMVKWGYFNGLIERDHMLAWFDHNQTNGWLRHDQQEIPA